MDRIIDFHVHTFPEKIAKKALSSLSEKSGTKYYTDGTLAGLRASMTASGTAVSVILPVATSGAQCRTINETACRINERFPETGILSFGGIHPENDNYREILRELKNHGVKGIKLHPVYQNADFDSAECMRIVECACENDLIIVVHAGFDVGFPGRDQVTPGRILHVMEKLRPEKLVLAHMGGWCCWDEVEEMLAGTAAYFDTAFSLTPIRDRDEDTSPFVVDPDAAGTALTDPSINRERTRKEQLSLSQFRRLVEKHGSDRILFGSDSPWSSQAETISFVRESGLSGEALQAIFYDNARKLL